MQGMMTFHADPVLKYTPKRNGVLILEVEDLYQGYGKDYHYLLWRHRQMPAFNAFVSPANITIPAGGTSTFRVDIDGKVFFKSNKKLKEGEFTNVVINEFYDCDLFGERVGD